LGKVEQGMFVWTGIGERVGAQSKALDEGGGTGTGKERELHQGVMYIKGPYHQNMAFLILAIPRQSYLPFLYF